MIPPIDTLLELYADRWQSPDQPAIALAFCRDVLSIHGDDLRHVICELVLEAHRRILKNVTDAVGWFLFQVAAGAASDVAAVWTTSAPSVGPAE